jgi:hypothetical protein
MQLNEEPLLPIIKINLENSMIHYIEKALLTLSNGDVGKFGDFEKKCHEEG